jgi:hypothetical protein
VALHGLAHETLLADPREQDRHRHLALAEAGDLEALREVGRGVLDRVLHVVTGYLDLQPNAVSAELFDLRLHSGHSSRSLSAHRGEQSGFGRTA